MSMYVAPHHVSSKRSRTRLAKILLAASLLVPTSLLAIANAPVSVDPSHNPIYTTIQDVQSAINTALAPIQSAIVSLQQQQTNQATQLNNQQSAITDLQSTQSTHTSQISDLQAQQTNQAQQIAKLQSSTAKNLIVYDANNQELGLLIGHGGNEDLIYSPLLNELIYIADNAAAPGQPNSGILSSGIGSTLSRIYYLSSNCTGTPYGSDFSSNTNTILGFSSTENYTYHSSDSPITSAAFSWRNSTTPTTCQSGFTLSQSLWPLYPITLPFPTPVAEPVQLKYQ